MSVIICDHQESTGGTISINIPSGRRDYLLLAFLGAHDASSTPSRGATSGGGGSWTTLSDEEIIAESAWGRIYARYSIPTQRGDISIDVGSVNGDGRYSVVYSLSSAEYLSYITQNYSFPPVLSVSAQQSWAHQGGKLFGLACAVDSSLLGTGPLPADGKTIIDESQVMGVGNKYAGYYVYSRRHTGVYNGPPRETAGISWGTYKRSAHIQLAVNSGVVSL